MFEHLDDYRGEAPFGVWVRSIAVSRCLMAFRSPWHRARVALESWTEESWAGPPEAESRTSDLIDLDRALARLSPVTRAVVWLYDVEGWSHEEIAKAFDRTVSFSKSQLARGHARLRDDLLRAGDDPASAFRSGVSSMDIEATDAELVARLKRLDAAAATPGVSFGYGRADRPACRASQRARTPPPRAGARHGERAGRRLVARQRVALRSAAASAPPR